MAVYCKKCGNALNDNAKFCPKCGTPNDGKPAFEAVPVTSVTKEKKKKPIAAIIISLILVLAVAAAGVWFFLLRDKGEANKEKKKDYQDNFTVGEDVSTTAADEDETDAVTDAPDPDAPTTIYAGNISDPELKSFVEQGRVTGHTSGVSKDTMNKIISEATSLDYVEIDEQMFADELLRLTGCKVNVAYSALKELIADYDNFYYIDASDPENEAYLVVDKTEKSMLVMTHQIYDDDGYWLCEKLTDKAKIEKYLNGKDDDSDSEVFYVLDGTGETVLYGKTVEAWVFYYNDSGDLFLCMNCSDAANPKLFNGSYEPIDQTAGNLVLKTVLDNIALKYGKELVL